MHSSMMPGSNSLTQHSADCVDLLCHPSVQRDSWDDANLHSFPYLLLWFRLVTKAVLINTICSLKEILMNFSVCFHQPDAEGSVLLCQF